MILNLLLQGEEKILTIQVGLIGYGYSGMTFHAPLINKVDNLSLKAVNSSNDRKVKKDYPNVEVLSDLNSMLADKDIDVVIITSPNTTHYEYAKMAILAGKHVVVEKPFTIMSSEATELIELAKKKGVLLTVFHNRRWDSDFLTIQELIKTKVLGNLSTYEAHFDRFRPNVRDRWREKNIPGSGILYDLGSHLIDQALTLFGMPKTVWADLRAEREGAEAVDYFHMVLGYKNLKVILQSGSLVREAGPRFILHGDRGSFIKYGMDSQEDQLKKGLQPGDLIWEEDSSEDYGRLTVEIGGITIRGTIETLPGQYTAFYENLVAAIKLGTAVPILAEEARDTIRIIEYAIKSHQEQRNIEIL
jgi:scyllo-inositol 2-dehydrogenase (NADP+)